MRQNQCKTQRPTLTASCQRTSHKVSASAAFLLLGALSMCLLATRAQAQAPGLLWSTNVGSKLFAADALTNAYANVGGNVIKISGNGVPFQTNTICPLPGAAQRDGAGNYYFAGSFDGLQDFGGVTLLGGCTDCSGGNWAPGWPSGYLAKYSNGGSLQWVVRFGRNGAVNEISNLALDAAGNCYVGYRSSGQGTIASFNNSGTELANQTVDPFPGISFVITVGGTTSSNCAFFIFRYAGYAPAGRMNLTGGYGFAGVYPLLWRSQAASNAVPVIDGLASLFEVGRCFDPISDPTCSAQNLRKYGAGSTELWSQDVTTEAHWTLARDTQSNVYLAGINGMFAKFDTDGFFVWSNNFSRAVSSMVVDSSGNRFLSFSDGDVARLAADSPPQAPTILTDPQPLTVFVGDPVSLSVTAGGTLPFKYFWRLNGTNVAGATDSVCSFNNAAPSQAGSYTVVVTNVAGSITSAPALVRVKSVQLYWGSQMLTNGTYVFASPPTLSVHSAFSGGSSFYTLDGSTPSFASTLYSGPFTLSQSAMVHALGYSADFSRSEEADAINAVVIVNHTLSASSSGGGSVNLNPPGGTYASTNLVTATAMPATGWSFMYWLGDGSGTNPSLNVSMERDKHIHAVFGTTLSTTVAGNGSIQLSPPGGFYPIGTIVRLTAVPQPGSYFGFWGNAASGSTNPLYFTISAPTQTVSSIFAATPAGQAALTTLINGRGRVNVNPRANLYAINQTVTLTPLPDAGEIFLNWSGDGSGTQNPLTVSMTQSKVITANFTSRPFLRANRTGVEGFTPEGFRLTLVSDPQSAYQILASTNLNAWDGLGTITNFFGEVQFTDTNAFNFRSRFYKASP